MRYKYQILVDVQPEKKNAAITIATKTIPMIVIKIFGALPIMSVVEAVVFIGISPG
jgi:hypothetical protein